MGAIHISALELERIFPGLINRMRAGEEVIVDDARFGSLTIELAQKPRRLSEILRSLQENGSGVTLDGDFARDVEEGIAAHRHEFLQSPGWE